MISAQQPEAATRAFARVLGPYLLVAMIAAGARASELRVLLADFGASPTWPWVSGAFVLLGGLVVIALHPYWRGAAAAIVSALGWLSAIKGLLLMTRPGFYLALAGVAVDGPVVRAWCVVLALAGLYLTYVGWAPRKPGQAESEARSTDRPSQASRAA